MNNIETIEFLQNKIREEVLLKDADFQRIAAMQYLVDSMKRDHRDDFEKNMDDVAATIQPIQQLVTEVLRNSEAASVNNGCTGLPTGFEGLDDMIQGLGKGELIILGGRPSMGKTSFLLSVAKNLACDNKKTVLYFSYDLSGAFLCRRLMSMISRMPGNSIAQGKLDHEAWDRLEVSLKKFDKSSLFVDNGLNSTIGYLTKASREFAIKHKVDLIIVDYLQLVNAGRRFRHREQEVSFVTRELKALARELNVPVFVSSQLNRSVEMRSGDKRPQLSDLRESGAIEQEADKVLFIHRPEYYGFTEDENGNPLKGIMEVIVAKNRMGALGDALLKFEAEYTSLSDPYYRKDVFGSLDTDSIF